MEKFKFNVSGMHCSSCVMLIETESAGLPGVSRAKSSLANRTLELIGDFGDKKEQDIAEELARILRTHGYELTPESEKQNVAWSDFKIAVPVALAVIVSGALQKLGFVDMINSSEVGYGTAFLVGVIASVSTCMAVVGGLALSLSANFAKENDRVYPQAMFHVGRLVSFLLLGGTIGMLGSAFQLGTTGTVVLGVLVSIVLLVLGVNLLDVFPWAKRLLLVMPSMISKRAHRLKNINHALTPLLVGVSTFFLPCGFTQSMQVYALTTGSFLTGALTMFFFAVGTLPVLALLSFSSLGVRDKRQSSIFFKAVGLVVIFFGLFSLVNSLVAAGIMPPLLYL